MRKLSLLLLTLLLMAALPTYAQTDEPEAQTIADVMVAAASADEPQFATLLAAVQAADPAVLEKLSDPEADITVFAPSNEAFAALEEQIGEEAFAAILADTEALTQILLYHVIEGAVTAEQAIEMAGEEVTTLQGTPVTLRVEDEKVFVNEAEVITPDIQASNGVIHAINAVLLPPTETALATEAPAETQEAVATEEVAAVATEETVVATEIPAETQEATAEATETAVEATAEPEAVATEEAVSSNTIADVVIASTQGAEPQFTVLLMAVQAAVPEVLEALANPNEQLTVFAPTDEAFAALQESLGEEEFNALLANQSELSNILLFHVVRGKVLAADIAAGFEEDEEIDALVAQTMLPGQPILITQDGEGNFYIGGARIITTDIEASNGIIHVIDAVLDPTPDAEE